MIKRILVIIFCVLGVFLVSSGVLRGAVFNVSTASELQNALTLAQANGEDDIIRVAQGTYIGNFNYQSPEAWGITLLGGYTADFASRLINPSNTVLDGGGTGIVLMIRNYASGGDIFVEGFTIRGGKGGSQTGGICAESSSWPPSTSGSGKITLINNIILENIAGGSGGGAYALSYSATGSSGDVIVTDNTITTNSADYVGGGILASSSCTSSDPAGNVIFSNNFISGNTGTSGGGVTATSDNEGSGLAGYIIFTNNVITENTASVYNGGGIYIPHSARGVIFTNNTITGNIAYDRGAGANVDSDGSFDAYNNIIRGNTAPTGADIWVAVSVSNGYNNDYSDTYFYYGNSWTNSGGNINVDPQFIGGNDYHLKPSSPCIDKGINSAPDIPDKDIDGNPRITDGNNDGTATVDMGADEYASKEDFLGTWDGQGVYYRNSDTKAWVKLASPADLVAAGDLDGDGIDDLIGIWSGQGGVWIRYSKTGAWTKLSSTANHISAGDMNGDGREDLLGTWDGQGVYYRDSLGSSWVKLATPATLITAGDLDGDSKDDLIGIWPTQGGVWVKYSKTGTWAKLASTARDIAAGDMNGDGRDDLLATWDGQGVYYRDSISGSWVKMATPADQVTCGDIDGDETKDLIGIWAGQGGVWVKYSETGGWAQLSSTARDIAAGVMRGGAWGSGGLFESLLELPAPIGGYAEGPLSRSGYLDLSAEGPGGWRFGAQEQKSLIPQESGRAVRTCGPGDPGFSCFEQNNLFPQETPTEGKREKVDPREVKR